MTAKRTKLESLSSTHDHSGSQLSAFENPVPAPIASGNSEPSSATLANLKQGIEGVASPQSPTELFLFVYQVRQFLSSDPLNSWLLTLPTSRYNEIQKNTSIHCATMLRNRVPSYIVSTRDRPPYAVDLLALYEANSPDIADLPYQPIEPTFHVPIRSTSESITAYFERLDIWIERYFPELASHELLVPAIARLVWSTHCQVFNLSAYVDRFRQALPKFRTIAEMKLWFQQIAPIHYAVTAYASREASNNVQGLIRASLRE